MNVKYKIHTNTFEKCPINTIVYYIDLSKENDDKVSYHSFEGNVFFEVYYTEFILCVKFTLCMSKIDNFMLN